VSAWLSRDRRRRLEVRTAPTLFPPERAESIAGVISGNANQYADVSMLRTSQEREAPPSQGISFETPLPRSLSDSRRFCMSLPKTMFP
jgi:hypothetical protein